MYSKLILYVFCKCSEMDIVLDLWLHTIYNDSRITGSDVGPVVYFRNGSHSPLVGYDELGKRWCVSKSTAGRILRKLEEHGYLKLVSFPGKYGTAIYLNNYLSTMFNISDVTIDKEEVAMSLGIRVRVSDKPVPAVQNGENVPTSACQNSVSEDRISVSENDSCVPKTDLVRIIQKAVRVLSLQGFACASCIHARYSLSPLSDDCPGYNPARNSKATELLIRCPGGVGSYRFALQITPYPNILAKTGKEVS